MSDPTDDEASPSFADVTADESQAAIPAWSGITSKVALGSLWGTGGQIAILSASILSTPFVLRLLSTEQYGLLSLVNLLLSYVALSDLGMQPASTRFATAAHMREGDAGEARAIWNSFWVTLVPGLLVAVSLLLCAGLLADRAFHVPAALHAQAVLAFRVIVIILLARNIAGVANTPQLVRLRFDIYTLIGSGSTVLQMVTLPLALYFSSRSVVTAAVVMAIYALAMMLAHLVVSVRLLPALRRPQLSKQGIRELTGFGISLVGMSLLAIVLNSEKLLLAHLGSLSALAFYSVAYTLASLPMIAANALGQALMPGFAKLHAAAGKAGVRDLFYRVLRLLALVTIPTLFLLCVFGGTLLRIWAGSNYAANGIWPLYILAWGVLFDCFAIVPAVAVYAVGTPRTIVWLRLLLLLPYLGLAVFLVSRLGATGAAIAMSCRALAEFILQYEYSRRLYLGDSSLRSNIWGKWIVALVLLFSPLTLLAFHQLTLFRGATVLAAIAYALYGYMYLLQEAERNWITSRLRQA